MASGNEIIVRRVEFDFAHGIDPIVIPGHPEESFAHIGLSLLLPYLEPYLIRSMGKAKKLIDDPALARDVERFNGQEGQHYRQHERFNDAVALAGFPGLAALERELEADYQRFSETKSLRWNLAYAEGFEAYTTATARFSFEHGLIDRLTGQTRELFRWHLVEELEHRTVAFDVYDRLFGGYWYRLFVGLYAQWHLNRFVFRAATLMAEADKAAFEARFGGKLAAWRRLKPFLWLVLWQLLPKVWATYLPWYTPHRIPLPAGAREIAEQYTSLAEEKRTRASLAAGAS